MTLDPIEDAAEFTPAPSDRLLLVAPHPDDEALAAGGLLELATRRGAAVRVLYVTRGENNPWAQRVGERRLRVGPGDRERWGEKRWAEALSALARLGVPNGSACCLGFPDQGLSDLLLRADASPLRALEEEIARWRPTLLLAPAIWDGHPDHSALGILTRLARIPEGDPVPLVLQYVVHRRTEPERARSVRVPLDDRMRQRKGEAILCHRSQVALRRSFLLRFVGVEERFIPLEAGAAEDLPHPIRSSELAGSLLRLEITRRLPRGLGRPELAILIARSGSEAPDGSEGDMPPGGADARWTALRVRLDLRGRLGILRPDRLGGEPARIPLRVDSRSVGLDVPLPALFPAERVSAVFANVIRPGMRRLGFFDAAGWKVLHARRPTPETRVRESWEPVPEKEEAPIGANSLAGVVAAQGFEPRTKGL